MNHTVLMRIANWHMLGTLLDTLLRCTFGVCRHIVEFRGVGCVEPHTPDTMASTLFIVQEFMSGSTLKASSLS